MNKKQLTELQSMVDDWREAYSTSMDPTDMDYGKMDAFEQAADTLQSFINEHSVRQQDTNSDKLEEVRDLYLKQGRKIAAVKLYRDVFGCSLLKATRAVETMS